MSPDKNNEPIKITLDDLARVETTAPPGTAATPGRGVGGAKVYGSVAEAADQRRKRCCPTRILWCTDNAGVTTDI